MDEGDRGEWEPGTVGYGLGVGRATGIGRTCDVGRTSSPGVDEEGLDEDVNDAEVVGAGEVGEYDEEGGGERRDHAFWEAETSLEWGEVEVGREGV